MVLLPCEAVQTATTSYTAKLSVCFRSSILPQRIRCAVLADCVSATLHSIGQSSRHNLSIMHVCHDNKHASYKYYLTFSEIMALFQDTVNSIEYNSLDWR